jgi:acetyltransferase-like isoleucine patch superfamily enzyme
MKASMKDVRPLLVEHNVFLMAPSMSSIADSGMGYQDNVPVSIQENIRLEPYTTFWAGTGKSLVSMGSFSYTGSLLSDLISVGRYSSIATGLTVMGNRHPHEWASSNPIFYANSLMSKTYAADRASVTLNRFGYVPASVVIGNDVWIGANVTLAHGITLGDGCVVASNSVVTKDVEPYSIVAGVPAVKRRNRFSEQIISDLLSLRWWDYAPEFISKMDVTKPEVFCEKLSDAISSGELEPYSPKPLVLQDFLNALPQASAEQGAS